MDIVALILSAVFSLLMSIILVVIQRRMKKQDEKQSKKNEKDEKRYQERKKRDELSLTLQIATADLTYACAMALKRGKANGEVEEAVEKYDEAMEKFRQFEREQLAKM